MASYVTAVHTFQAEHGDELEFEAGDRIEVLERDDAFGDGWWRGRNKKGEEGLFPATYITENPSPISATDAASKATGERGESGPSSPAYVVPSPTSAPYAAGPTTGVLDTAQAQQPPSPRPGSIRSLSNRSDVAPDEVAPGAAANGGQASTGGEGEGVLAAAAAGLGAAAIGVGAVLSKTVDGLEHALDGLSTDDKPAPQGQNRAFSGTSTGGLGLNENTDIHRPPSPTSRSDTYSIPATAPDFTAARSLSGTGRNGSGIPASIPATAPSNDRMESYNSGLTASEDDHNMDGHGQGYGIDTSARARLAAQAKIANDREMARANNRISTGVSGLVYSDESDGDDDDEDERRTSYRVGGYGSGIGNGHPSGPALESFGSALQPALMPNTPPLPAGATGAGTSQPVSSSHTPRSGSLHTASPSYPFSASGNGSGTHNAAAAAWSVDEVVEWAKSKGFDESIWSKFQEHEITGDLLLELDANLLKELDIPAFGKRLRIAQAIGELKRPSSGQGQQQGSPASGRGMSQPPSAFVMPGSIGMTGAQSAPGSALGLGAGSAQGQGQGQGYGYGSRDSGRGSGSTPPSVTPPLSGGPADGYAAWAHPPVSSNAAGAGAHSSNHSRKTSSIAGSVSGSLGAGGMTAIKESDRANVINTSVPPSPHTPGSGSISGPILAPTNGNGSNSNNGSARNSSSGMGATLTKRNSAGSTSASMSKSASLGHKRGKSSLDVGKERLSFFGRNRKPAPQAPEGMSTSPSSASYSNTGTGSLGRSGSSAGFKGFGGNKVHQMQPASPNQRSPSSATAMSTAAGGLGGSGALRQIGTPDYSGWMKKKGDRYGWKNRYFVLKGSHLYYLKSEHEDKVKGHIPLAGYRVKVDENANPGSYGFRLEPASSTSPSSPSSSLQPHAFSSSEQTVIREWMKALLKATIARDYAVPVTSSCNIPTIPLAEAQALQPRPPSPTTRERTQRATRRENTSSLTPHDASVLTSLTGGPGSNRISLTPSRPERDVRRPSAQFSGRTPSEGPDASPSAKPVALSAPLAPAMSNASGPQGSIGSQSSNVDHTGLLTFVNSTLPPQYPRATSFPGSFVSGEVIFLLVRSVSSIEPNPPVPPSAFAKDSDGKPGVDGLFAMMDMLLDAGIDPAGVSLNEVREGNREAIGRLVGSVRSWYESR